MIDRLRLKNAFFFMKIRYNVIYLVFKNIKPKIVYRNILCLKSVLCLTALFKTSIAAFDRTTLLKLKIVSPKLDSRNQPGINI